MYPLGKMMQLKLELFEENLDKYRKGKTLNQVALYTGNPIGTFTRRDPHPWVKGLIFDSYRRGTEGWVEEHVLPKRTFINQQVLQTGLPKTTFKRGDKHPTIKNLFFFQYFGKNKDREQWFDKKTLNKKIKKESDRLKSKESKAWFKAYRKLDKVKKYNKKYREENPEVYRRAQGRFWKTEKGRVLSRVNSSKRYARKIKASVGLSKYEEGEMKQIYAHAVRVSNKLHIPFHVDHIVPLSKGGLHHPSNMQICPASWNMSKNNRNTERWLPNGM